MSAPGKDIRTTTVGGYATDSGTSLAAPFVAGLAGLVKSQHPTWSAEQVKWQVLNTAVAIDALNPARAGQLGKGRINAGAALATNPQPRATVESYAIDGQAAARPAPGQAFQLVLNVRNLWLPAENLQGALASSDPYVSITDAAGAFGDIAPGQLGSNSADPFGVTLSGAVPYNHALQFTLNLSGAGSYSLAMPFTVQVRSAVETLGNTIYTANTTWTSDKSYVLAGTVIVNQGVTLTIQPGTVIKANPGKFIRVDGTLIARGTAAQPIVFTTNSITNATWSGIRFTASAVNAAFNAAGDYTGGSIVQSVEVRHADIGISLAGRAPYIADSLFADSGVAIQTWADGAVGGLVRIERNHFTDDTINVSGGATIVQNEFRAIGDSGCGVALQGGSPLIMQNSFTGAGCSIGGSAAFPSVISNTLQGGGIKLDQEFGNIGVPAPLPAFLRGPNATQVDAGGYHTCALLLDGGIQCWGKGESGQLGNGGNTNANTPQTAIVLARPAAQIATGAYYTCVLLVEGSIECWGEGSFGQLGNGDNNSANTPQTVIGLAGPAAQIAGGHLHTCALLADGTIQCWGSGVSGQLGNGGNVSANTPQTVTGLAGPAKQVVVGFDHTCALLVDGTIQCWGAGSFGQLGNGGNVSANTPQTVTGLAGPAKKVTAGGESNCALLMDGSIQCWGAGSFGQLGNSGNANANTPQTVTGLSGPAKNVTASGSHTCALLADVTIQCWGRGLYGQLGNGDHTDASIPQTVVGLGGPAENVTAGGEHTCALLADSSIQCWGAGWNGQLGNGSTTFSNTPQHVIHGVVQVVSNIMQQGSGFSIRSQSARLHVQHNNINANKGSGLAIDSGTCSGEIVSNTVSYNQDTGISLTGAGLGEIDIHNNNLFGNGTYDLYLTGGQAGTQNFTVDATNNFWNVDASQIPNRIRDCTFDDNGCGTASSTVGKVVYNPPLANPEQTAPAFVRSVTMNPNPVGLNQRGTVTIDFSKPMSTVVLPVASFHDAKRGTTEQTHTDGMEFVTRDIVGRLWFGRDERGVYVYNGRQWESFTSTNSGLGGNSITAMYSASNGDIWFAHDDGDAILSRLRGSTWITYTRTLPGISTQGFIYAIGEDSEGAMWFGGVSEVLKFNNGSWQRFTTQDGVSAMTIRDIARDGHGRMWLLGLKELKYDDYELNVYDGVRWTTYNEATGLPTRIMYDLLADSAGRIWVRLGWSPDGTYLAMHDGRGWQFFGSAETGGILSEVINMIMAPNGVLWFSSGGSFVTYDGVEWQSRLFAGQYTIYAIDKDGSIWYGLNGLSVIWGGLDYPFADGKWLSPTRFQASYSFDANILPGFYIVQTDGAIGDDGMTVYTGSSSNFQVDFGSGATFDPPTPPLVAAQTSGSLNHMAASWQASSPGIDQYRYAIGTTPGGRDVVGWTYLTATSFTRSDLALRSGQTYYVTVGARNTSGLWSVDSVSNVVIGGQRTASKLYLPAISR